MHNNLEHQLIQTIAGHANSFIGDDAALLPFSSTTSATSSWLISQDTLCEDIHFRLRYFSASDLAHKVLHTNLSDCAAMGARPHYALCSVAFPAEESAFMLDWADAFRAACAAIPLTIIGGDTTGSPGPIVFTLTILSQASCPAMRHTAQIGDVILCTGPLGRAHLGLYALENNLIPDSLYHNAFCRPRALLDEGQWLASRGVTSMMDISDGLLSDLTKLCQASMVGAQIFCETLTPDPAMRTTCENLGLVPMDVALCGGEDYQLLLTIPESQADILQRDFAATFAYPMLKIGTITGGSMTAGTIPELTHNGQPYHCRMPAFDHFR